MKTLNQLLKEIQENGYFIIGNELWNNLISKIDYQAAEIKRLKKSRDLWHDKWREVKK